MKLSQKRIDMENARLEQVVLKYHHEIGSAVNAAGTTTLDITDGNVFLLAHGADIATLNLINPNATGTLTSVTIIRTKDNSATPRLISWPAAFLFPANTPPTLTQNANAIDIITTFTMNGGSTWVAFPAALDVK